MSDNGQAKPDNIDAAIAATEQPQKVNVQQFSLQLPTGRPAIVAVPTDITDFELLALQGAILQIGDQLRAKRGPQLVVASRLPT